MGNPINPAARSASLPLIGASLLAIATIGTGGCALPGAQPPAPAPAPAAMTSIEGTVVYRERMALPGKVVVKVTLEDVTLADAPSKVIAEQVLTSPAGPPYSFSLRVDQTKMLPSNRYSLRATITADGRLMFTSTEHVPVLAGNPTQSIEILTRRTRM